MKLLDIGEVSKETGIPPSTLRYYDEIQLISSVSRRGLRRQFGPEVVLQLKLILMGQSAGFSLDEIAEIFGSDGQPNLSRPKLHERADELDKQIQDLTALRDTIRHVADCPAPKHMECPTFRRLVEMARRRGGLSRKGKPGKKRPFSD